MRQYSQEHTETVQRRPIQLQALISAALISRCRDKAMKTHTLFFLQNPTSSPWSTIFSLSFIFVGFIIMTDTLNLINYIHDVKIMMQKIQEGNKKIERQIAQVNFR